MSKTDEAIDRLEKQVAETETVVESTIVLIDGMAAELESAKNDPEQIQATIDKLKARSEQLGRKVLENTPAAPTEPPTEAGASPRKRRG